jgi:serine/threonine protein kinase
MALEGMQIGHYRLERLIGSGGMSEVYFAEDIRISRHIAVKVVRNEAALYRNNGQAMREAVRIFEREMKAITALDHPNILPLYDFGEEPINATTLTYMVMPFRSEGSLVNWLNEHIDSDTLSLQAIVHIVVQAASALQHAHNHRLVHLDVKPSNFLIRHRDDRPELPDVLLTDFGIARFNTATATASQSIRGTPFYMAPEQWTGNPVAATDQYALAVMAYQLLTGTMPFQGNLHSVMYQHLQEHPLPPSSLNPNLSAAIDAVLLRALAKKPEDRFPSIREFAHALEQASRDIAPPAATPHCEEDNPAVLSSPKDVVISNSNVSGNENSFAVDASATTVDQGKFVRAAQRAPVSSITGSHTSQQQEVLWSRMYLIALLALMLIVGSIGVRIYMIRFASSTDPGSNVTTTDAPTAAPTDSATSIATSTVETVPAMYPDIAGNYNGTIHNTLSGITTSMILSINQNSGQGNISGSFTAGPGLLGTDPFTGMVYPSGNIQFKVANTQLSEPLLFTGEMQSNGSMSGTYCSVNAQNQCDPNADGGTWSVTRSTS